MRSNKNKSMPSLRNCFWCCRKSFKNVSTCIFATLELSKYQVHQQFLKLQRDSFSNSKKNVFKSSMFLGFFPRRVWKSSRHFRLKRNQVNSLAIGEPKGDSSWEKMRFSWSMDGGGCWPVLLKNPSIWIKSIYNYKSETMSSIISLYFLLVLVPWS